MGARGAKVKDITAEFDVQIKFPERDSTEGADVPIRESEENGEPGANDIIRITGRPENCENAKKALLEQVGSKLQYVKIYDSLFKLNQMFKVNWYIRACPNLTNAPRACPRSHTF